MYFQTTVSSNVYDDIYFLLILRLMNASQIKRMLMLRLMNVSLIERMLMLRLMNVF